MSAEKRVARGGSAAWRRDRMNETHRKGRRGAKKDVRRAQRRVDKAVTRTQLYEAVEPFIGLKNSAATRANIVAAIDAALKKETS